MKPTSITILLCFFVMISSAQEEESTSSKRRKPNDDTFSLGVRTTQSLFGALGYSGMGFGGQFRIRLTKRINTEWFADHIKTDLGGLGHRETAHIGWSVMFYPLSSEVKKGAFLPYVVAGHCFDFAKINGYQHTGTSEFNTKFEVKRWSSAVQMGLGASYNLTDRFDASFSAQYMIHLGDDLDVSEPEIYPDDPLGVGPYLVNNPGQEQQLSKEGHLLLSFSLNYRLAGKLNPS